LFALYRKRRAEAWFFNLALTIYDGLSRHFLSDYLKKVKKYCKDERNLMYIML